MNREERERLGNIITKIPQILPQASFHCKPNRSWSPIFLGHMVGAGDLYLGNDCGSQLVCVQMVNRDGFTQMCYVPEAYCYSAELEKKTHKKFVRTFAWYSTALRLAKQKKLYTGKWG
jgi:hypothetical protein